MDWFLFSPYPRSGFFPLAIPPQMWYDVSEKSIEAAATGSRC